MKAVQHSMCQACSCTLSYRFLYERDNFQAFSALHMPKHSSGASLRQASDAGPDSAFALAADNCQQGPKCSPLKSPLQIQCAANVRLSVPPLLQQPSKHWFVTDSGMQATEAHCLSHSAQAAASCPAEWTAHQSPLLQHELSVARPLQEHSKFVFVPGPGDAGPSSVLPQPPLRKQVTAALREKVPCAIFASNPCRLRFYSQQVVIFRGNVQALMRRLCLVPPTGELGCRATRVCVGGESSLLCCGPAWCH